MRADSLLVVLVLTIVAGGCASRPDTRPAPPPPASEPRDPPPHDLASDAGLAKRKLAELEKTLAGKGDSYEARVDAAKLCFTLSDKAKTDSRSDRHEYAEKGVEHCRVAIGKDGKRVEAFYFRAICFGRMLDNELLVSPGQVKKLADYGREAEARDERYDCAGPHRMQGCLYAEAPELWGGDWDKAVKHFERSIELAPGCPENLLEFAEALHKHGDEDLFERARGFLRKAVALSREPDPKHAASEADYRQFSERAEKLLKELGPSPALENRK